MAWIKKSDIRSISAIVSSRTGMTKEELINDTKEYHVNNLDKAIELFMYHFVKRSKIACFCDYDTDGITSSDIVRLLSDALNVGMKIIVPRRFSDGYGIKTRNVETLEGYDLLILCDNGIAANEAVDRAKELGMDVIILDHHEPRKNEEKKVILPKADVVVDPHITGGDFKDYCGAGLTYLFAKGILKRYNKITEEKKNAILDKMLIFAAIGTVGDVVSLTGENRRIVANGIKKMMEKKSTTGLQAVINAINKEYITSIDIGFNISPIFNASGRLHDTGSKFVSDTVGYDDKVIGSILEDINELIANNEERKELSQQGYERAEIYIQNTRQENNKFIVVIDEDTTTGIVGLISGKITEKYKRPSIVFAPTADPDIIKGSGRAPEWADLKGILDENKPLIEVHGGHPAACGITLKRANLEAFTKAVNASTPDIPEEFLSNDIYYDIDCELKDLPMLMKAITTYAPYGQGNPEIIVRLDNIDFIENYKGIKVMYMGKKEQHVKLHANNLDLIWFDGAKTYKDFGEPLKGSVLGTLSYNVYNGYYKIQLQIIDFLPSDGAKVNDVRDLLFDSSDNDLNIDINPNDKIA